VPRQSVISKRVRLQGPSLLALRLAPLQVAVPCGLQAGSWFRFWFVFSPVPNRRGQFCLVSLSCGSRFVTRQRRLKLCRFTRFAFSNCQCRAAFCILCRLAVRASKHHRENSAHPNHRSNPALNLAPFVRWTLRDKAAQRGLPLAANN